MGKKGRDDDEHGKGGKDGGMNQQNNMLHMTAELIPKFSGQDATYSVTKWVQDVEDNSEIFQWTPMQQLLVARRSLVGTAELWLKSERPFKTWEDLKTEICREFPCTLNTKAIHEMMAARKKRSDESCLDYLLTMKEMGKRGKLADYVAIEYIVDGINDRESNKVILHGVKTYAELKEMRRLMLPNFHFVRVCTKTTEN